MNNTGKKKWAGGSWKGGARLPAVPLSRGRLGVITVKRRSSVIFGSATGETERKKQTRRKKETRKSDDVAPRRAGSFQITKRT